MSETNIEKRMEAALIAGQHTLESLRIAQNKLEDIRSWEVRERFGKNLFASMIKNMKISDIQEYLIQAKSDVLKFQIILKSICMLEEVKNVTRIFISFANFFLDGTIEEYLVKSKVDSVREQIEDAVDSVEKVCIELEKWCTVHRYVRNNGE